VNHPELDYSTPVTFSFRQRVALSIVPRLVALIVRVLFGTCRVEVRNEHYHRGAEKKFGCAMLVFWHEALPLAMWCYRRREYHTLTSYSYDGEIIARVVGSFGLRALRGSSSRGGHDALIRMEATIKQRVTIALTPDGPRGPRRKLKAGAAVLGERTGVPVVPVAFAVTRCWRMKSWDRMVFPKPFSTILCEYGEPVWPGAVQGREPVEARRDEIERALNSVQERLESGIGAPA
jgi:hypothetical protein